jgi:Tol biopolymer transport system component
LRQASSDQRELWYASLAPSGGSKPVRLGSGAFFNPFWSPDGKSVLFLRAIDGASGKLAEIHEASVEGGAQQCVAPTTRFAAFAPTGDAFVFAVQAAAAPSPPSSFCSAPCAVS